MKLKMMSLLFILQKGIIHKQLMEIVGGITANGAASQRCCGGGSGACTDATSTGCGTGGSTCVTNPNQ